jgi:hypothetical protein
MLLGKEFCFSDHWISSSRGSVFRQLVHSDFTSPPSPPHIHPANAPFYIDILITASSRLRLLTPRHHPESLLQYRHRPSHSYIVDERLTIAFLRPFMMGSMSPFSPQQTQPFQYGMMTAESSMRSKEVARGLYSLDTSSFRRIYKHVMTVRRVDDTA